MAGQIFVISGPSGVGKTSIIQDLRDELPELRYSISHTTRKPRQGEQDGVNYHFTERTEFEDLIKENAFVEWAKVYTNLYGTSFKGLQEQINQGLDVLLDIDVQGAANLKKHFKESCLIFILPPSLEILAKRLRDRGTDDEETIRTRQENILKELKAAPIYDFFVVNNELDAAVQDTSAIIQADRCSKTRMSDYISKEFGIKK